MKLPDRFDIVISGASYAGLALARALSMAFSGEARIAIIDRNAVRPAGAADVRAFAITAASKRMLDVIGVWQAVQAASQPVSRIEITDSSLNAGVRPVLAGYENVVGDSEHASFIVPAAALESALAEITAADGSLHLFAPANIASIESTADEVQIRLAGDQTIAGSLLVAADGRHSSVRDMAGIKSVGWSYRQVGIVTIIRHEKEHEGRAVQHFLPGGPFALLPLPGRRTCVTWSEDETEARRVLALDDPAFLAEVEQRVGGKLGALELDGPRMSWPLALHLARSYVAPRIALIGDAAHVVHPIAGQGLNLALRDVAAMAEVLADTVRIGLDFGNWDALCRYERWRRFDVSASAAAFDGLNTLFSNDGTILRAVRDAGLGIVDRLPALKQVFVEEAAGLTGELPRLLRGEAV